MKKETYEKERDRLIRHLEDYIFNKIEVNEQYMPIETEYVINLCAPINALDKANKNKIENQRNKVLPLDEFFKNMEI